MRDLLGGKGANVAEMTRVLGAERVPAGFTITTEACVAYMDAGRREPDGLSGQVAEALDRLEQSAGRRLGDAEDPLLVSVRSGARESMPGMLDTILNLGLNDESVDGLAREDGQRALRVGLLPALRPDVRQRRARRAGRAPRGGDRPRSRPTRGVRLDTELDVAALRELTDAFKGVFREATGEEFPQDPQAQLDAAIRAVFDSWTGERAVAYRRINRIPDDWGTAVNVQQMVFGNKGETSGSGVAFSRDEITGEPEPSGDFLVNAQGEDVVSGVRNTLPIREMREVMPDAHAQLLDILRTLEAPLPRHAGHGVHRRGGAALHAADARARSVRRRRPCASRSTRSRRGCWTRGGARDDRRGVTRRAAASDVRPQGRLRGDRAGRQRVARRGQGRGGLHGGRRDRRGGRGARRDPRAPVHGGGRRGGLPRRARHPHQRGRQGVARRPRGARDGAAVHLRGVRPRDRPREARGACGRARHRRGRLHRDRRHDGGDHGRGRPARRGGDGRGVRAGARLGRRAARPAACARTPTRRRTRRRRGSSARRGSASAGPSTCSWPPTASRRCAR